MEIRKVNCKTGNTYYLVNDSWSNSTGWGHITTLMYNKHYECSQVKTKYLNRTWEMYTYQTSMYRALEDYESRQLDKYIMNYKSNNNIIKFKSGQKQKVIDEFYKTEEGKDFTEIRERIRDRKFDE